jgi:hypothetical protein
MCKGVRNCHFATEEIAKGDFRLYNRGEDLHAPNGRISNRLKNNIYMYIIKWREEQRNSERQKQKKQGGIEAEIRIAL